MEDKVSGKVRLVMAETQTKALAHVTVRRFEVSKPSASDAALLAQEGVKVEMAGDVRESESQEPEKAGLDD